MRIRTNTLLATAPIPDGGGELRLYQRNEDFVIEVVGIPGELMSTAIHGSEDALAELALKQVKDVSRARVLVGGLGMGFTLAAALRGIGARGEVVVAELVPEVVEWNKGPMGERSGNPMKDPRAKVFVGDVLELIRTERDAYDAILLDTDNGPEGLTQARNNRL
jgi:spermidine synthase